MASKKPDFKRANILANEILAASSALVNFPANTKGIIKEWSDLKVLSFKRAHEFGIDIKAFGSETAVILCKNGRYIVFYNQNDPESRIKFSLLHEFGHYYLGHELKEYTDEDDAEYGRLEVEANCFAAQILMPEQVLNELKKRGAMITVDFLKKHFGVSEEAAQKRIETMGKINYEWKSAEEKLFDETILFKYKSFMDSILPKRNRITWFEDEYDMQRERDSWQIDNRSRYGY
ncbi:ImmA/IrrE family metallo-endopeptidase [[Clostridium] aminophilum]|uniref:IrrE N-terminal-like domain-containing protein n=1 Tax=[Clostridium] aminophilum TaxID=1526 RepID=A0A1I6KLX9_9FIRM|nr:ImmA/IrrE family metallo-endopeptidase [[Clostridium] aminophilum]SFR92199.1 protein of unknown function [[Clostridium] aminophilum]